MRPGTRFISGHLRLLQVPAFVLLASLVWPTAVRAEVCSTAAIDAGWRPPSVVSNAADLNFEALASRLLIRGVAMIGEVHDRFDHHLNQLELICRLHRRHPDLAIGLEFFQQPFQKMLDAFVDRRIDSREMLVNTEYYDRWRFDYRLYAPILEFARENSIPLLALNLSQEVSAKVARMGLSSLSTAERAQVPSELDRNVAGYRERLQAVYEQHPEIQQMSFENFVEAQLVWDETMAERAAQYLKANPDQYLVVLAGNGHITRSGIPTRVARRSGANPAVVLQEDAEQIEPEEGDYLLVSQKIELSPGGKLGVKLDTHDGRVVVSDFSEDSAAREAGILKRDQIVALNGQRVKKVSDLKLILLDKRPGDTVSVSVERASSGLMKREASYRVLLR